MDQETKLTQAAEARVMPSEEGGLIENVGKIERIASLIAGGLMIYAGTRVNFPANAGLYATGAALALRGASGYCPVNDLIGRNTADNEASDVVTAKTTIHVDRPRNEVYQYWRKLENLPNFMKHLKEVNERNRGISHWEARIPGGMGTIQWDAKVVDEQQNERLAWQSLPGSTISNAGEVDFRDGANGSTYVTAVISYRPPAGTIGSGLARVLNPAFERMVKNDLERFKEVMEAGTPEKAGMEV